MQWEPQHQTLPRLLGICPMLCCQDLLHAFPPDHKLQLPLLSASLIPVPKLVTTTNNLFLTLLLEHLPTGFHLKLM